MKVQKYQHIATLCFIAQEEIASVHYLGDLGELKLPQDTNEPLIAAVIPHDAMMGLTDPEKDKFKDLLNSFKDVFATLDMDLGCAKDETHTVDTYTEGLWRSYECLQVLR